MGSWDSSTAWSDVFKRVISLQIISNRFLPFTVTNTLIQILIQTTSINLFTISTRILQPDWVTYFYVIDSE